MPAVYRYEVAKQGRAGCQNSACKNEGVKIAKGELRFGTLVQIPNYPDSWKWKHWGCVTPVQIANILGQLGGLDGLDVNEDLDILDGYDELPDWAQQKIRDALTNGHVDDEDWKGDPELNRPGQKGINKRTPKKKKNASDGDSGASETEESPVKPKKGSRKKKRASSDDEDEDPAPTKKAASKKRKSAKDSEEKAEAPPPKKRAAKSKKVKDESEDDNDDADALTIKDNKKGNSRAKKASVKKETTEDIPSEPTKKKGRTQKVKQESDGEAEDQAAATEEASLPQIDGSTEANAGKAKPNATARKGRKRAAPVDEGDDNQDGVEASAARPIRGGRNKKAKTEADAVNDATDPDPKPAKAKASKKSTGTAEKDADDGEVFGASDKKKQTRRGRGKKGTSAPIQDEDTTEPGQTTAAAAGNDETDPNDTVEVESDKIDEPAQKDKKKGRKGRSARRSDSKSEKA